MQKSNNDIYPINGVFIRPALPHSGDQVRIVYNGLLSNSGASEVYARVGIGENWKKTKEVKMNRVKDGFEAVMPIRASTLQIAFHDTANNWDNNNGYNYVFSLGEQ